MNGNLEETTQLSGEFHPTVCFLLPSIATCEDCQDAEPIKSESGWCITFSFLLWSVNFAWGIDA